MTKRLILLAISALPYIQMSAQKADTDTLAITADGNTIARSEISERTKREPFFKRLMKSTYKVVKNFSRVDTNYIEPQKYNFTFMMQNTNTYESYTISSGSGNDFMFSPQPSIKIGPYVGWRWLFLGYTLDVKHLRNGNNKQEFDLSLYSSQIGIDLFYRKTGNDYRIKHAYLDHDRVINTEPLNGVSYDGINVGIKGFNLYYIFNHKRFSYPAAFSQSTIQRRSSGSALCGIGYTKHSLSIDWDKLYSIVSDKLGEDVASRYMSEGPDTKKINYTDISLSGGYAYNWVFAHNWLAAISLSAAIGYKGASSEKDNEILNFRDFSFHNFNLDGVGRLGLVWNNMKWYYGMSAIFHTYNYRKSQFRTNTTFGNINLYIGFNFGKMK